MILLEFAEDRDERSHPRAAGDEHTGTLILDRAPGLAEDHAVVDFDVAAEVFGHAFVLGKLIGRIGLDHEFQTRVTGQTGDREGTLLLSIADFVDGQLHGLSGRELEALRPFDGVAMNVFGERFAMHHPAPMFTVALPIRSAAVRWCGRRIHKSPVKPESFVSTISGGNRVLPVGGNRGRTDTSVLINKSDRRWLG